MCGILCTFRPTECDLALLSASEIYGASTGVCMWQTDEGIVIFFSFALSHTVNPDSGRPLFTSPNKNMSLNYSINTHRDAWSSKRVTQLSFLSIKHQLPSALPSVNLLNNPCHLSRGTSSHATHRVTFQSTSQHLPEVKISHWSCVSFLWLQPRWQTFQTNARTDLGSAERWEIRAAASEKLPSCPSCDWP